MNHELIDLQDRLQKAAHTLGVDAAGARAGWGSGQATRLEAKREGVLLALSYVEDAIALAATPLDEVEVSPARHSDPPTSKAAALTLTPTSAYGKLAACFYRVARTDGHLTFYPEDVGYTAEEAIHAIQLGGKSPWKRVSELRHAGILEPTGYTSEGSSGRQQQRLRITEFGKHEVERLGLDAS